MRQHENLTINKLDNMLDYRNHPLKLLGVMKIGNIVPRVGIEPRSLAFRASVLPLHHVGSLMAPLYPYLPVYAAPYLRGQCSLLQYHYGTPPPSLCNHILN